MNKSKDFISYLFLFGVTYFVYRAYQDLNDKLEEQKKLVPDFSKFVRYQDDSDGTNPRLIDSMGNKLVLDRELRNDFLNNSLANNGSAVTIQGVEKVVSFTPTIIQNTNNLPLDISVTGVLIDKQNSIRVTSQNGIFYENVLIDTRVILDGIIRVTIVNNTGEILALPELTLHVLQLN